jgi:hypothetical protein
MEELRQYLREKIIFDEHEDESGKDFRSVLFDELDRIGIYDADLREFFNIDADAVLKLAQMECMEINYNTTISDIAREAQTNLAFNYMYSELYNEYMKRYEA